MQRTQLLPGVAITHAPADAFKRCRISISFILPGDRATATGYALLPMVMERGYAACPDMTALSRRLACLYGAGLSVGGGTLGPNRVITVGVSGIRNEYAVGGEDLLAQYLELVFGMAFDPDVKDGAFDGAAVAVEKDKLLELQQSEINDKRIYCLRQARRRFFGDDVGGLEKYGYAEDLDAITPAGLYDLWQSMVRSATVEAVVLGADAAPVAARLQAALGSLRAPAVLNAAHPMPPQPPQTTCEPVAAVQGKLAMLFTMAGPLPQADLSKMRLAVAVLGGAPTSRLFMNVREKQSLCYYCSAGYSQLSGCLSIDSGVDFDRAEEAKQAILHELEDLATNPIPQKELEDARRYLLCALEGVWDSLPAIEGWFMGEISRGTMDTPADVAAQLAAVTAEDVQAMLRRFSLSVVYCLTEGGTPDDDE